MAANSEARKHAEEALPDGDVIRHLTTIRVLIAGVQDSLKSMCAEPSRELSLALTKLDEARLWGMEAIAIPATTISSTSEGP